MSRPFVMEERLFCIMLIRIEKELAEVIGHRAGSYTMRGMDLCIAQHISYRFRRVHILSILWHIQNT
ncbi:hypothetical protein B5F78_10340 [Bacteroides sp. An279]|nr:hypothetical protein B5F78_10340 [Bacteroides sp. An279]